MTTNFKDVKLFVWLGNYYYYYYYYYINNELQAI